MTPGGSPQSRFTTARTLSLLTAGVVFVVLSTGIGITWVSLRRAALAVTQERLSRGVRQLAAVSEASLRQTQVRFTGATHDSAIVRALRTPERGRAPAPAVSALQRLQAPTDSGLPIELWTADERRVAFIGDDVPPTIEPRTRPETSAASPPLRAGVDSVLARDSLQFGHLYVNNGRTYFWIVMPVLENGRAIGYVAQQRRIAVNRQTEQTLRELTGSSVSGYYRNADGSAWTTFSGTPANPPEIAPHDSTHRERLGSGQLMYADEAIAGTPLWLTMEIPRRTVLAESSATVRNLALFGAALTILGALFAGLFGRRLTRPLVSLTAAAESIATGDYSTRVPTTGSEEVARLANSFNRMAAQVGESQAVLENREGDLHALANAIPQLAWMADSSGTVFWFNDRWYEFTGFSKDLSPESLWMIAHTPEIRAEMLERWSSSVRSSDPFEMETLLRSADGTSRWFLTRVVPTLDRDGRVTRWFGTATDIQALREAREAAEAGSRAKSDFLAAMSHELRTPLNAIAGYTELLEMGLRGPLTREQRRDLSRIRASQQHLLGLVGAVLDLSRIESGRVAYEMVNIAVAPFLSELQALVKPQVLAKEQSLVCRVDDIHLAVFADREKLRQVLLNLLSNAVRFSPAGGTITIGADAVDAGFASIFVRDTGRGIPADRQSTIFEPFVQLDRSLTHTTEGVGLGLAISRDLARGMGGELTVESAPGEGACFTLSLHRGVMNESTVRSHTLESPIL